MENNTDLKEVLTSNQCECDCHQQVELLLQNTLKDKKEIRELELKLAKLEGLPDKIKDKDQIIAALQYSIELNKNNIESSMKMMDDLLLEYKEKLSRHEAIIREKQDQLDKLEAVIKEKDNLLNKKLLADDKSRSQATFCYTVENVFESNSLNLSPPFYLRMLPWKIMVIPHDRALGFFLQCNEEDDSPNWSCNATAELRLENHKPGGLHFTRNFFNHLFCSKEKNYGYENFISWQELQDTNKSYVLNNSITLEVHVIADPPNFEL